MQIINSVIQFIMDLGGAISLPFMITILGLFFKIRFIPQWFADWSRIFRNYCDFGNVMQQFKSSGGVLCGHGQRFYGH